MGIQEHSDVSKVFIIHFKMIITAKAASEESSFPRYIQSMGKSFDQLTVVIKFVPGYTETRAAMH